jgi:hypothetical protein
VFPDEQTKSLILFAGTRQGIVEIWRFEPSNENLQFLNKISCSDSISHILFDPIYKPHRNHGVLLCCHGERENEKFVIIYFRKDSPLFEIYNTGERFSICTLQDGLKDSKITAKGYLNSVKMRRNAGGLKIVTVFETLETQEEDSYMVISAYSTLDGSSTLLEEEYLENIGSIRVKKILRRIYGYPPSQVMLTSCFP